MSDKTQSPQSVVVPVIRLTTQEIQSGHDRQKWAEGLIRQLPEDHDGRNSWLINYGETEEASAKRSAWNDQARKDGREPSCVFNEDTRSTGTAAPAPSSLAGGEVTPEFIEPFVRQWCVSNGIDPDEPTPPHGEWPRWYDEAGPFAAMAKSILAALSPEAPARDGGCGQCGQAMWVRQPCSLGLDPNKADPTVVAQCAALTPRHEAPASPTEREIDLLDAVMRAGGIVKTAAALPDKAAHLSLLTDALNRADAILTEGLNGAPVRHEAPACDDCGSPLNSDGECVRDLAEREGED